MNFNKTSLKYLLGALLYFAIYLTINLILFKRIENKSTVTQSDFNFARINDGFLGEVRIIEKLSISSFLNLYLVVDPKGEKKALAKKAIGNRIKELETRLLVLLPEENKIFSSMDVEEINEIKNELSGLKKIMIEYFY